MTPLTLTLADFSPRQLSRLREAAEQAGCEEVLAILRDSAEKQRVLAGDPA